MKSYRFLDESTCVVVEGFEDATIVKCKHCGEKNIITIGNYIPVILDDPIDQTRIVCLKCGKDLYA